MVTTVGLIAAPVAPLHRGALSTAPDGNHRRPHRGRILRGYHRSGGNCCRPHRGVGPIWQFGSSIAISQQQPLSASSRPGYRREHIPVQRLSPTATTVGLIVACRSPSTLSWWSTVSDGNTVDLIAARWPSCPPSRRWCSPTATTVGLIAARPWPWLTVSRSPLRRPPPSASSRRHRRG